MTFSSLLIVIADVIELIYVNRNSMGFQDVGALVDESWKTEVKVRSDK